MNVISGEGQHWKPDSLHQMLILPRRKRSWHPALHEKVIEAGNMLRLLPILDSNITIAASSPTHVVATDKVFHQWSLMFFFSWRHTTVVPMNLQARHKYHFLETLNPRFMSETILSIVISAVFIGFSTVLSVPILSFQPQSVKENARNQFLIPGIQILLHTLMKMRLICYLSS